MAPHWPSLYHKSPFRACTWTRWSSVRVSSILPAQRCLQGRHEKSFAFLNSTLRYAEIGGFDVELPHPSEQAVPSCRINRENGRDRHVASQGLHIYQLPGLRVSMISTEATVAGMSDRYGHCLACAKAFSLVTPTMVRAARLHRGRVRQAFWKQNIRTTAD